MEASKSQNIHSLAKFTDAQFLKMVTQLLLSVSVFSFFFSHSSLFSFLHSLNFYLSTLPYQLFTHTIDKNCIFLLCNGLLVFLAKYSGLIRTLSLSSPQDHDQSYSKNIMDVSQSELSMPPLTEGIVLGTKEAEVESIESTESVVIKEATEDQYCFTNQTEAEIENEKPVLEDHEEQERDDEFVVSNEEEQEEEEEEEEEKEEENALVHVQEDKEEHTWSEVDLVQEEEEEEEEVGNGMLSTEELNKKFDEFIRRMKEELRIEAQRQLIMV
ncbi:hypothetical protein TorRG33x02_100770 [Trema orientale]|uniref:Transmembrane protein n=1 Tax=Trema orientale TaxID=63057 RepID=A0A2P5F8C2_TREOI|nr:hypothetical protein TorRG33x02_100770 [Trema orientale]